MKFNFRIILTNFIVFVVDILVYLTILYEKIVEYMVLWYGAVNLGDVDEIIHVKCLDTNKDLTSFYKLFMRYANRKTTTRLKEVLWRNNLRTKVICIYRCSNENYLSRSVIDLDNGTEIFTNKKLSFRRLSSSPFPSLIALFAPNNNYNINDNSEIIK